ncbi:MAG: hypothetical protein HC828_15050 [Blastochloris sp.]|nr:hypothetical protein [Blastochloris sp.]
MAYFIAPLYEQTYAGTLGGESLAFRYSTVVGQRVIEAPASADLVFQSDDGRGGWQTRGSLSFYNLVESDADAPDPAALDALSGILETRPTTPTNLPPLINPDAMPPRALTANARYLSLAQGEGVRYIEAFAADDAPLLGDDLQYVFQGIIDDGRYFLAAAFPVATQALPPRATFDFAVLAPANYAAYLDETRERLTASRWRSSRPDLALLDMLIESIVIGT